MGTRPAIEFTNRDRGILVALTFRVRMITPAQAARAWWPSSRTGIEQARRRLSALGAAGFVRRVALLSHPELDLRRPTVVWAPGQTAPAFASVAYRLQKRWAMPIEPCSAFVATRRAANDFGGRAPGLKRPLQATHDLHVTTVYVRCVLDRPELVEEWLSEDILAPSRRGEKLPDAEIVRGDRTLLVVEFGGAYDAARVERVHRDCVERRVPYELW